MNLEQKASQTSQLNRLKSIIFSILFILIILSGTYFRTVGLDWDEGRHLHPDERYLSMVLDAIQPVDSLKAFFETDTSSLNPANRGYGFFVYGTLPIFLIRLVGEAVGQTGYDPITLVGRQLSALMDIITVVLVFLIGLHLYNRRVGLIASAFYAFAVLPIQQAHFMTVDTFTNTFGMLTVLAGVLILKDHLSDQNSQLIGRSFRWRDIWLYVMFGLGLGMATASKINAISLALLLPLIEAVNYIQTTQEMRLDQIKRSIKFVLVAALISFIVFRIAQPYAFNGPGIFNFGINQNWLTSMQSLRAQSKGLVDSPPALQWVRRPGSFSINNLILWGLGLPFGLTASVATVIMGWQIFKKKHWFSFPIWAWTLIYFAWQGFAWVKSMRYLLLIYPLLALIAAWGLDRLIKQKTLRLFKRPILSEKILVRIAAAVTLICVLGTGIWAFAFTRIYTRPVTRIEATEWIYENLPGPVNLLIDTDEGEFLQQAPYRAGEVIEPEQSFFIAFRADYPGKLTNIHLPSALMLSQLNDTFNYSLDLTEAGTNKSLLITPALAENSIDETGNKTPAVEFILNEDVWLRKDQTYVIEVKQHSDGGQVLLSGVPNITIQQENGSQIYQFLPLIVERVKSDHAYNMDINVQKPGKIYAIEIPFILDVAQSQEQKTLQFNLSSSIENPAQSISVEVSGIFTDIGSGKGSSIQLQLNTPLILSEPQNLRFSIVMTEGEGQIALASLAPAHESSWDDALPTSKPGYIPYSDGGGIFRGDLNLELYWPDDASKRSRFYEILSQADYIFISSNRQWGTTTRVTERYPLTSQYYRSLLGCPKQEDLVICYNTAELGKYTGELGFELIKTFTSYPNLGNLEFNDQFAEEAFSVYDHPKVMIFKKSDDFDPLEVLNVLESVDLTRVLNLSPAQLDDLQSGTLKPANNLMLTDEEASTQRSSGTWSEIFNRENFTNKYPVFTVIIFYFFTSLLGLAVFPIVKVTFPGLKDKGYAFSRLVGLLIFAYLAFILGSSGVAVSRLNLLFLYITIFLIGSALGWIQRESLKEFIKSNWKQLLLEELIFLIAFGYFLWIRYLNPDLWHPWRGGEKPMDFSYLNAVIKSDIFPAYDPWFAGGYINYYYYGQIIVGMPIKLLGIIPAVAYNLVLPLWYAMLFLGAFSVGWNITKVDILEGTKGKKSLFGKAFWAGLATALLLAFLGNLGEVKLLNEAFRNLGTSGQMIDGASVIQRLLWTFKGIGLFVNGTPLPVSAGSWYWNPSRTIPGEPITEFPYFTFLYADLHAHLIAMPIVILSVAWGVSLLFSKGKWSICEKNNFWQTLTSFLVGALIIGALKPTNTWDYYTFLILNLCIIGYVGLRYFPKFKINRIPAWMLRLLPPLTGMLLLIALSAVLYIPFNQKFFPGFSQIGLWEGERTPISSYLIHWGLLIYVIFAWFAWESFHWMSTTPVKKVKSWIKYRKIFLILIGLLTVLFLALLIAKVKIVFIVLPLCVWALALILLPDQSDAKRFTFFMIGTGLTLTLAVELVYLIGDIGRMNVVFKLYLQSWLLITLSIGFGLMILWFEQFKWPMKVQLVFQLPLVILIISAFLFPLLATKDKITDRMDPSAPHTLDGMKYMESSYFYVNGVNMNLDEDYRAIQWMQDNVKGSPVILEAQAYEYYWGNRYTIYTGLPGVVGWNYHQRQQRAILYSNIVQERVDSVNDFYLSQDVNFVKEYIDKYKIEYIVVGQQEKAFYPNSGLMKFEWLDGILWEKVYSENQTTIYRVK